MPGLWPGFCVPGYLKPTIFVDVSPDFTWTETVCFCPGDSPFSNVSTCEPALSWTFTQGVTGHTTRAPSVTFAHG